MKEQQKANYLQGLGFIETEAGFYRHIDTDEEELALDEAYEYETTSSRKEGEK